MPGFPVVCDDTMRTTTEMPSVEEPQHLGVAKVLWHGTGWLIVPNTCKVLVTPVSEGTTHYQHMAKFVAFLQRSRGVTVSTLDPESSDRGSNPREAFYLALSVALPSVSRRTRRNASFSCTRFSDNRRAR